MENIFIQKLSSDYLDLYDSDEIKYFEDTYNYCINYLNNFNILDIASFRKILNMLDELMTQQIIDVIPSLNTQEICAYEKLYNAVINALNKEVNGKKIGEILISDSLENGKVFTIPELAYDCDCQYKQIGLNKLPRFSHLSNGSNFYGATDLITQDVMINGYSKSGRYSINKNVEEVKETNLELLITIRHEFQHVKQGKDYYNSEFEINIAKYLYEFEKFLRTKFAKTGIYHAFHDSFSTEYEADVVSYEKTMDDLKGRYKNKFSNELIEKIQITYENRKNNYNPKSLDELVNYALSMVDFDKLNANERVELLKKTEEIQQLCFLVKNDSENSFTR